MKRANHIFALAVTGWAFATSPAGAMQGEIIPFEMTESGHMAVVMTLNDASNVQAVIDTGATFPLLDHKAAQRAGIALPETPTEVMIAGLGEIRSFPVVDVDRLRFGEIDLSQIKAAYNSDHVLPGALSVIPSSSIPHRTIDFDFKKQRLLAYDRRPMTVHRSTLSRLPITRIGGLPYMEVSVNGTNGLALIDTGASISFVNSAFANTAARSPSAIRTIELVGATGTVTPIKVLSSRRFAMGDFLVRQFDVVVADAAIFNEYDLQDQPVMVLGLDILGNFRLQIDRQEDEVYLSRPRPSRYRQPGMTLIFN